MRNTKRRLETLAMYDHTGISRHLEKMAAKGWMLERIANYGWMYRRTEPKKLHFAVSYFAKASEYDPEYSEEQKTLHEFCAHTGWELVCTSSQMQIFCNAQEDPIPIETDPELEVETIHEAMHKDFLKGHVLLLILGLVFGFLFLMGLVGNVIATLADPMKVFTGICWLLVVILTLTELIVYERWHTKAVKTAEQGQFLDTPSTRPVQIGALVFLGINAVYLLANLAASSNHMQIFLLFAMAVPITLAFLAADWLKRLFKKWKLKKTTNKVVSFLVTWFIVTVVMNLVTFGTVALKSGGFFEKTEEDARFENVEHPLRVEDLLDVDHQYVVEGSPKESMFLANRHVRQRPWFDVEDWSTVPHMEYDLVKVKWPFLYDDVMQQKIKDVTQVAQLDLAYEERDKMEPMDPEPWGAAEAYRIIDTGDDDEYNRYLLCYEDMIAEIGFSWEVTPEQMAIVGGKIG